MNYSENLQILPLGNVRLFRRIRKNDTLFLKMCVFREHLVNLCVFRGNLVKYLENLQILPMGSVRHFRRIHENYILYPLEPGSIPAENCNRQRSLAV